MAISRDCFGKLAEAILEGGFRSATKYFSPKLVVRATKRIYPGRKLKTDNVEIVFTIGRPNYAEREFIKKALAAGEPFPIKRVLYKLPIARPKAKAKKRK